MPALVATTERHWRDIQLRIVCLQSPDPAQRGAEFGLQEKRPGDWLLHAGERRPNGDVVFDCECEVTPAERGIPLDFHGRFVHGKRGERFLYLSWKPKRWTPSEPEPGPPHCVRRMKIHLKSLTWPIIEKALRGKARLQTKVAGTARDGGPNCASVLLIDGWQVTCESRNTAL